MRSLIALTLFLSSSAWAHVPSLLLPLPGMPIATYFVGQSEVSRAIYSEISKADDFFVVQTNVTAGNEKTLVQLLTPVCNAIPEYERYQPRAMLIRGELPWKKQGESNLKYLQRLQRRAVAVVKSNFPEGQRPKLYEEFGNQYYWIGGEWRGRLRTGLHSIVVFDPSRRTGNFTLGLNEKERWTPDLFKYVAEVLPRISEGICRRTGFSGRLELP